MIDDPYQKPGRAPHYNNPQTLVFTNDHMGNTIRSGGLLHHTAVLSIFHRTHKMSGDSGRYESLESSPDQNAGSHGRPKNPSKVVVDEMWVPDGASVSFQFISNIMPANMLMHPVHILYPAQAMRLVKVHSGSACGFAWGFARHLFATGLLGKQCQAATRVIKTSLMPSQPSLGRTKNLTFDRSDCDQNCILLPWHAHRKLAGV